ncbi:MAG: hypothetical protein MUD00_02815 [Candidatus Pacebacteria bacterium]|jgi:hypothetical protein|nr:hypothetical protein [Candidatus Paceibacterota bacterium]
MKRITILGIIGLIIFVIYLNSKQKDSTTPVACTMDAKICPDGTAVGRVGPNCDFAACPVDTSDTPATTTVDILP